MTSPIRFSPRRWMHRLRYEWKHRGPVITGIIIALCVLMWLVEQIAYYSSSNAFASMVYDMAFIPALTKSQPWIFLTSMFMHAPGVDVWHILGNMITLWFIAPSLEKLLGHWQFLALYLLSGLGGDAGNMVYARVLDDPQSWLQSSYGASGAIFGLFGALLVAYSRMHLDLRSLIVLVAINLAMPFFVPNIAWQAHVGGLLTGAGTSSMLIGTTAIRRVLNYTQRTIITVLVAVAVIVGIVLLCRYTSVWNSVLSLRG